jgi:beta-phosphoglucomutase
MPVAEKAYDFRPNGGACARIPRMSESKRAQPPFAVLWDLDGVLVDTRRYHFGAFRRLLEERGQSLSEERFQELFGLRNEEILPHLIPGLSEEDVAPLSDRKEDYFRESLPDRVPALPGAEELVRELAGRGVPQAIASSTPCENIEAIVDRLGLPLKVYVGSEDVDRGKPYPDVFLAAAAKLAVPAWMCVVVEDAQAGVEAARRAAMASLAVATTWPAADLAEADRVVESLEEVTAGDLAQLALRRPDAGRRDTD